MFRTENAVSLWGRLGGLSLTLVMEQGMHHRMEKITHRPATDQRRAQRSYRQDPFPLKRAKILHVEKMTVASKSLEKTHFKTHYLKIPNIWSAGQQTMVHMEGLAAH